VKLVTALPSRVPSSLMSLEVLLAVHDGLFQCSGETVKSVNPAVFRTHAFVLPSALYVWGEAFTEVYGDIANSLELLSFLVLPKMDNEIIETTIGIEGTSVMAKCGCYVSG